MQGLVQLRYALGNTVIRVPDGLFHFRSTRLATPLDIWTNATCEPSSESTGEVETMPAVLYCQYTEGLVPLHPE